MDYNTLFQFFLFSVGGMGGICIIMLFFLLLNFFFIFITDIIRETKENWLKFKKLFTK